MPPEPAAPSTGLSATAPSSSGTGEGLKCETCDHELQIGDWPYCPHGSTQRYAPFSAFETTDDAGRPIKIESMKALRDYERSTMEAWQRGERVSPTVFRAYSQDASNRDKGVFGRGPAPEAEERAVARERATMAELRRHIASVRGERRR